MPDVDIVTTHHYPGGEKSFAELIRDNAEHGERRKSLTSWANSVLSAQTKWSDAMNAIMDTSARGGLLWSLRFRDRDGGFYWHSEPGSGGNLYKAFHWPGSPIGNAYDEINLMTSVRTNAFAIRGLPVPPVPVPAPPNLLPITDAAAISWQGSVGATGYQVERAANRGGDWQVVATNVDEAFTQYRPQFADETVPAGNWFYRVRARTNPACRNPPMSSAR